MPKYDIPIIATIEAASMEEARQKAYSFTEIMDEYCGDKDSQSPIEFAIGNDSFKISGGKRIVILHPEDATAEYDPEEYDRLHAKDEEEEG